MSLLFKRISVLICFVVLITGVTASMSRPPRNDIPNMTDAYKYLHDLDSYYSNVARPRFGKRFGFSRLFKNRVQDYPDMVEKDSITAWSPKDEPF